MFKLYNSIIIIVVLGEWYKMEALKLYKKTQLSGMAELYTDVMHRAKVTNYKLSM